MLWRSSASRVNEVREAGARQKALHPAPGCSMRRHFWRVHELCPQLACCDDGLALRFAHQCELLNALSVDFVLSQGAVLIHLYGKRRHIRCFLTGMHSIGDGVGMRRPRLCCLCRRMGFQPNVRMRAHELSGLCLGLGVQRAMALQAYSLPRLSFNAVLTLSDGRRG